MIGAKALLSLGLLGATVAVVVPAGYVRPARLAALEPGTAFWIGVFGAVVGLLIHRLGGFGERSRSYFRLSSDPSNWEDEAHFLGTERFRITTGDNRGDAFDLPAPVQLGVCFAVALLVGVATVDARALDAIERLPSELGAAGTEFCPDPDEKAAEEEANAPGCALVRRAYALGYAESLGDCAPKKREGSAEICTLRQRDEPLLHYTWRLLVRSLGRGREVITAGYWQRLGTEVRTRAERADLLLGAQAQVMASAPRASHHIWTNLPNPNNGAFQPATCLERYRQVAHRLVGVVAEDGTVVPPTRSEIFEPALPQLLFASRYEPAAGYCREYQVHWDAPPDQCARLAARPEEVLAESPAGPHVAAALARERRAREVARLYGRPVPEVEDRAHVPFVSFQCYIEEDRPRARRTFYSFAAYGEPFAATEMRAPPSRPGSLHVAEMKHLGSLLARGFRYGGLMSQAGLESSEVSAAIGRSFQGRDFPLSRLQTLTGLDIFLDPEAIGAREDLLAVYPYHVHLRSYVHLFRRHYAHVVDRL